MTKALLTVLVLLVGTSAFGQNVQVRTDHGTVDTVVATHPSMEAMCKTLATKVGAPATAKMITFKPKTLPFGQDKRMGQIWVVGFREKMVEVATTDLSPALAKIQGSVARLVLNSTCYLSDGSFYGTEDVVMITANPEDAAQVASALR